MHRSSRRLVWLGLAVLAPCLALVALTVRLLDQETLLETRRVQQAEERRMADSRRDLLAELDRYQTGGKPVAFRGSIRNGRVVLPWDQPPPRLKERALLDQAVQSQSKGQLRALSGLIPIVTDDLAVPIALYAIPHLNAAERRPALEGVMRRIAADPYPYSPAALHLLRSLLQENRLDASEAQRLCSSAEAAEAFQVSYPQIAGADPSRWLAWGSPLYLIGFRLERDGSQSFHAVAAAQLSAKVSLESGRTLGEPFPGLRIQLDDAPPPDRRSRTVLLAPLGAALLLAGLGGMLLWRDFHRERQLIALRTQFIAGVSHELRTPLTSIRMFIESMRMNPGLDAPTREEYLDTMQRESERLSRLVDNVLEFSRMERQTKTYALRPLSLQQTVEGVVACFRPVMEHAGYKLQTTLATDVPELKGDPDALEQAIGNLLTNAMKYSGTARRIEVNLRRREREAEIEVRDFGFGIPPADHARIFDPYYRVPSKENTRIQGAGLGLAVVKHVMQGHGGEVTVESVPGQGSAFRLVLPL